jgi:hypothetical protein
VSLLLLLLEVSLLELLLSNTPLKKWAIFLGAPRIPLWAMPLCSSLLLLLLLDWDSCWVMPQRTTSKAATTPRTTKIPLDLRQNNPVDRFFGLITSPSARGIEVYSCMLSFAIILYQIVSCFYDNIYISYINETKQKVTVDCERNFCGSKHRNAR